jgi:hypothetical protein
VSALTEADPIAEIAARTGLSKAAARVVEAVLEGFSATGMLARLVGRGGASTTDGCPARF